jgi:poly-gamma-glutamate capsule biosynthesis protein CapA/YwtB (metallophosphatase superfamily)
MRGNKQNLILIGVLLIVTIMLFSVKAYKNYKCKNTASGTSTTVADEGHSKAKEGYFNIDKADTNEEDIKLQARAPLTALVDPGNIKNNSEEETRTVKKTINIKAVGDIVLGRGVEYHLKDQSKDYTYPFKNIADVLRSGDIVFGNLEVPMTDSEKGLDPGGKYVIKSEKKAAEGIKYAGFNVLNLANNHIMDYYERGLFDTMDTLEKHEIMYCGAGKNLDEARLPAIMEVNGATIAVLGYTDMSEYFYKGNPMIKFAAESNKSGVAPREYESIAEDIEKLHKTADIIIISLHWGVEDSFEVTKEQIEFAHKLIDHGADIILGHHPHKFQGIEIYKEKPIIYSMGNFIFDQNDPLKQESFIVNMDFIDNKLASLELLPIRTISKTHIVIPKGEEALELLKRELKLCGEFSSKCAIVEDKIVFNINSD